MYMKFGLESTGNYIFFMNGEEQPCARLHTKGRKIEAFRPLSPEEIRRIQAIRIARR